jgi:hypothetical protein
MIRPRAIAAYLLRSSSIWGLSVDLTAFSEQLRGQLLGFAWDEWAQMGVSAVPRRVSRWAQDPEALIVFTLEVARSDPRLFDELLDWMLRNESLLTVPRLRATA